jgi:hypothetical protein
MGVGEAGNRTRHAVQKAVLLGLICFSMATLWYARKARPRRRGQSQVSDRHAPGPAIPGCSHSSRAGITTWGSQGFTSGTSRENHAEAVWPLEVELDLRQRPFPFVG